MTAAAPPSLVIRRLHGTGGVVGLRLLGELDLAAEGELRASLAPLRRSGTPVRLDLSELSFIDCGGLHLVMDALAGAKRRGWQLEVDRDVSAPVRRVLAMTGTGPRLWPTRRAPRVARPALTDALLTRVTGLLRARRRSEQADAGRPRVAGVLRGR